MTKDCALERMGRAEIKRNKMDARGHGNRKLHYIKTVVFKHMNKFVENVTISGNGVRFGLYIDHYDAKEGLDGLYTRDRLTGRLKAIDM